MNGRSLAMVLVLLAAGGSAVPAAAQQSDGGPGIVGTWVVQVTPRDCSTGAPAAATLSSLVTFHKGGTMSESAATLAFAPGQRTAGHGGWTRQPGHTYLQQMVNLILFDTAANLPGTPTYDPTLPITPGFRAGWQTVTHTVTLDAEGNLESSGTNAFYRSNGELYRSGCSTAFGRRFN